MKDENFHHLKFLLCMMTLVATELSFIIVGGAKAYNLDNLCNKKGLMNTSKYFIWIQEQCLYKSLHLGDGYTVEFGSDFS